MRRVTVVGNGGRAVVGADLVIRGDVKNATEVEVHGTILGSLAAERVTIAPGGSVRGRLDAVSAEINGLLDGHVRVRQLISIGSNGVVRGNVRYGQLALSPGGELAAHVRNVPPELGGDFEIVVRRGRSVRITSADLVAFDPDDEPTDLVYHVASIANGHISRALRPSEALEAFTEADIRSGTVVFVHDGTGGETAAFEVAVTDASGASSVPRRVDVKVVDA